ncbi:hypothetical protein LCGC14_1895700 [marine sediment metagenome]|uniref:Uncharacterized protein n=1 Tax=marine sediment metagenome TaxID=412755 RepID=A0A0F9IC10_9ZZZZ
MPNNTIKVTGNPQGIVAKAYDGDGVETDITAVFQKISGAMSAGTVWTSLELMKIVAGKETHQEMKFQASEKELNFEVAPELIAQVVLFKG